MNVHLWNLNNSTKDEEPVDKIIASYNLSIHNIKTSIVCYTIFVFSYKLIYYGKSVYEYCK